jgi:alkylation response protein AidB-like acyl-CoA dehydrogenase
MLDLTLDHVKTREQFGRPLGAFQTIKHRLADVRLWQECAVLAAATAWDDGSVDSAALAKALACRFTSNARIHCQQFLGGMGFTWEHPFHRYLRRALTLEPMLGGAATQQDQLGKAIRDGVAPDAFAAL